MVSEARPGPARLALPLLLGLRDGPLSSAPPRAPLAPGAEARARAWGARAAGALSAHTAASPVHEPGSPAPSRHRGPLSSSFSPSSSPSSSGGGGGGSSRPELTLLEAPLGSAPPARTTTPPEREQPRSWTKSFSAMPRAPTPSTPPSGAGSGCCPPLAAASTVGRRPGRRWALGLGAVSVCLSVSAAAPARGLEGGELAPRSGGHPPESRSLTLPRSLSLLARLRALSNPVCLPRLLSGALATSLLLCAFPKSEVTGGS